MPRGASGPYRSRTIAVLMIAITAFSHLDWTVARTLELGPLDFQRKLGEAVEPASNAAVRIRIRDRALAMVTERPL